MTADFNMNTFLNEQQSYLNKSYTAAEIAQANTEARDVQRAKEAIEAEEQKGFLSLTVGEKLKEIGIGEHVINLLKDTAVNTVTSVFTPLTEYLEKYENIFDQQVYYAELQAYGKQHFYNNMALSQAAMDSDAGTQLNYHS